MPTPGSIEDMLKVLNGKYDAFLSKAAETNKCFYEGTRYLKARSQFLIDSLTENDKKFRELPKETRRDIAWHVFKDIRQTGRLQRGDTDCRVHLVDGSWYTTFKNGSYTILNEFIRMLDENWSEELDVLYSDSYDAINSLLSSRQQG
ncbi:hypothetical protein D3C84_948310 [compost metagenome]